MRKPFIFIVYQSFEHRLAVSLQNLLQEWGCDVFQCRQDLRDRRVLFPVELRHNLVKCDLVLLLLSREFQWSAYCQAEAGTTMALEKPYINIIVPPADETEVLTEIAKVMQGSQFLSAGDPNFIPALHLSLVESLSGGTRNLNALISRLQTQAADNLLSLNIASIEKDKDNQEKVRKEIDDVENNYRLHQPKRILSSVWTSLRHPDCKESIIGNIINSLTADSDGDTILACAGVSLKFSLDLISLALKKYAKIEQKKPQKQLRITLSHMDAQSHILRALNDSTDITIIRNKFGLSLDKRVEEWRTNCGSSVELVGPEIHRIDYIPPRVGILIGDPNLVESAEAILYAGRCALREEGIGTLNFHLDVGENEYLFYKKDKKTIPSDPSFRTIEEFRASLEAYKQNENNSGVTPIWESDPWIARLREYIDVYEGSEEVTFISGTAMKFEPLITRLLQRSVKVKVYLSDSGTHLKRSKHLYDRLEKHIGTAVKLAEIRCYQHPATFRGVVIGDIAIGLQTYINTNEKAPGATRRTAANTETAKKIPLCFIVTPCFKYFQELKRSMLKFAEGDPVASVVCSFLE
jgi:hypothetical protein